MDVQVRERVSQHDAVADLPLITESARVTAVEKMDQDRRPEVTAAITRRLDDHDLLKEYGLIADASDWDGVQVHLADDGYPGGRSSHCNARRTVRPAQTDARSRPVTYGESGFCRWAIRRTPVRRNIASLLAGELAKPG